MINLLFQNYFSILNHSSFRLHATNSCLSSNLLSVLSHVSANLILHLLCVSPSALIYNSTKMMKRNLPESFFVDHKESNANQPVSCNYPPFADGNGKSAATNGHSVATGAEDEKERFLNGNQPVRLTPAWEENNLTNDELNMKSMTMDRVKMELDPPKDRYRLILLTLVLHGLGTLIPWNMFITAKSVSYKDLNNCYISVLIRDSSCSQYFVDYKLGEEYTGLKSNYAANFLAYLGFAAQIPNVLFNWLNIFIEVG